MRCYCCDKPLSGVESTRKFKESGNYTDMCDKCLKTLTDDYDIETVEGEGVDEDLFDDEGNPREE